MPREKDSNGNYVFHSYTSTAFLQGIAVSIVILMTLLGIVLGLLFIATNTFLGVIIILFGIILGIALTATLFVIVNMSDDQKYISENLEYLLEQYEKNMKETNELLNEQNDILEDILEQKSKVIKQE